MIIKDIIIKELKNFEEKEDAKVIFAVEAGSRAWGFDSPASDYDVRFVYVKNKNFYLQLNNSKDTIDLVHTNELDIVGWDLKKYLELMYKSNPSVYEWLQCKKYADRWYPYLLIENVAKKFYNRKSIAYHYYSMSENHDRRYIINRTPTKKRYLHATRATLSALWAIDNDKYIPRNIYTLLEKLPYDLVPIVKEILHNKKCGLANIEYKNIPELDQWLQEQNAAIKSILDNWKYKLNRDWNDLNNIFLECIEERNNYELS